MKRLKITTCPICHKTFYAKDRNYKKTCSWECMIERQDQVNRSMRAKRGKYWDNWKASMKTYLENH